MDDHQDDLPPSEAARAKRRDRDADARARAGMKTGLAKQFKQVLDAQVKRARQAEKAPGGDSDRTGRSGRPDQPPKVNE